MFIMIVKIPGSKRLFDNILTVALGLSTAARCMSAASPPTPPGANPFGFMNRYAENDLKTRVSPSRRTT